MSETEALKAEDVARYLRQHRDFFERHADLLAHMYVPHPYGDGAIALSDRQVMSLRDRNKSLETKLAELLQFGEENDLTSERMHGLVLSLLKARTMDALLDGLYTSMRDGFGISHAVVRLWRGAGEMKEFGPTSHELRSFADQLVQPYCGANQNFEATSWFDSVAPNIRSVALIALRDETLSFGLLVLASTDSGRFYPEMGTLYLRRIGDVVSAALLRFI